MKLKFDITYIWIISLGLAVGVLSTVSMMAGSSLRIIATVILCLCLIGVLFYTFKFEKKLKIITAIVLVMMLGYLLSCLYISAFMGRISVDEAASSLENTGTAVLLVSPGEMGGYTANGAVYRLKAGKDTYTSGASWWSIPIRAGSLRKNFKGMDKNIVSEISQSLYNKMNEEHGSGYTVYNAGLFGPPYLETVTREILKNGHDRIIVLINFLIQQPYQETISGKIARVMEDSKLSAEVNFTYPLWNHDAVASIYENRILSKTREISPEQVGIVLIGRECSSKALRIYSDAYKCEEVFFNKIKENMVKNGYDSRKMRTAYLKPRKPSVEEEIEFLLDSGVNRIVVAAAGYENPCAETEHGIPGLLSRVKVPRGTEIMYIGSWEDDDLLVKALGDRLKIAAEESK